MKNVCIIGGGPAGLKTYIELNKIGLKCTIFEANSILGGQITRLYPQKIISDVNGFDPLEGLEFSKALISQISMNDVHLNEEVINIEYGEKIKIITHLNTYIFDIVVLCLGLGFSKPRELGLEHENEAENILYSIEHLEKFAHKNVCIFGGGDSALDWTKMLDRYADKVCLIHRRDEFRGNQDTIKDCTKVELFLSYVPLAIEVDNNNCKSIQIQSVKDQSIIKLEPDYIVVCFGNIPYIAKFMFSNPEQGFIVQKHCRTSIKNIYSVGDAAIYEDKKKRIQPAFNEIAKLVETLKNKL